MGNGYISPGIIKKDAEFLELGADRTGGSLVLLGQFPD